MKTPPFLIGAALLFWGWQVDLLAVSAAMAAVLEGARYTRMRWEFSDDDFSRIWTICTLFFLGIAVYAFTDSGGPSRLGSFFQNPTPATQTSAGAATSRTASTMLRWLPMVLFLFVAAQAYCTRESVPLATISLILRRRWKKAAQLGKPMPMRGLNVSYPYFAVCLFAASVHPGDNNSYFWGFCLLLGWALWTQRIRRFGLAVWGCALLAAFAGGYYGQHGIGRLQSYLQNLDPQWFERFARNRGTDPSQTKTRIGRIGKPKLSGKIVIRVKAEPGFAPQYLREASYRLYDRAAWRAGSSKDSFQNIQAETNNAAYVLVGKSNLMQARITCYLEGFTRDSDVPVGLLPLPSGVGRLEDIPVFVLKMNSLGAVLAEGPGLVSFTAAYGPGPTVDSPFDPTERLTLSRTNGFGRRSSWERGDDLEPRQPLTVNPDLYVPMRERPMLQKLVSDWDVPYGDRQQAMRAINEFFSDFSYSTWQELPDVTSTNLTALGLFLTRTRSGHCEYFATATVLLLRQLGVPARYAVGYSVHEKSGSEHVVRLRDAHAWCLVWNDRAKVWQDFDTTPPSWVEIEAENASQFEKLSDLLTWFGFQFAKFRWGQSNLRQYMLFSLVPVMGLLAYQIFFRRRRHQTRGSKPGRLSINWPGLDSEFYQLEKTLARHGLIRHPNEPVSEWAERVIAQPGMDAAEEPLKELVRLHYQYRFDPRGINRVDRERLRSTVELCLTRIESAEKAAR